MCSTIALSTMDKKDHCKLNSSSNNSSSSLTANTKSSSGESARVKESGSADTNNDLSAIVGARSPSSQIHSWSRPSFSSSLARVRSQNGYSVREALSSSTSSNDNSLNDVSVIIDQGDIENGVIVSTGGDQIGTRVQRTSINKDPFEVTWNEGAESDPMCPRSMSTTRKWIITFIVSFGSFCV